MSDLFISYTHKDNAKLTDQQQGWVDRFHEALQLRLNMLCGRETQIWRDLKIQGTDLLTDAIRDELGKTALLLSILSPGYLNSEWCIKELRMFCETAGKADTLRIGTKSRVVKVLKLPVEPDSQSAVYAEFADSIGYPFYQTDEHGIPAEFDPQLGDQSRQIFLNKINELAYHLAQMLEKLSGLSIAPTQVAAPTGVCIYLAETGSDLADERERLRTELAQFGHTVLPEQPLPYTAAYSDRVRAELQRCRLSVHLIGSGHGATPEGSDRPVVDLQFALAGEEVQRRPDFVRLPWLAPGAQPPDEMKDDPRLLVTSLENLKTAIADLLAPKPAPAPKPAAAAPSSCIGTVYLVCDPADAQGTKPFEDWLFEQRFEVVKPLGVGDETQLREDHEENLKSSDAVLIYYGAATQFWLRGKLRDLQKAFGYGRQRPFAVKAVLLADPQTPDKQSFRSNEVLVLPAFGAFDASALVPFMSGWAKNTSEAV